MSVMRGIHRAGGGGPRHKRASGRRLCRRIRLRHGHALPLSRKPGNACRSLDSNHMLNRGYAYTTIISSKYHGQTLLSHLASLYPHSTPQAWQQKLNNREVTVNGVTATGSESLTSGQTLVWNRPPWIEPDAPQYFEVLLDDPHLLAVNKPTGLPTLPGGGFMENTLLRLVQRQIPNANPVHRLGRATTGIVLFTKTPQAASKLCANWNTPGIQKNLPSAGSRHRRARRLRNPHAHRSCTAPAHRFRVGRQPRWQTIKVLGEGDLTQHKHHNIRGKPIFRPPSSNQNPSGIHRPSPGRRSSVRLQRPAS
jgi:hypothetical protein